MRRVTSGAAVAVAFLLAILSACAQGSGPVVDDTRQMPAFSRIEAGSGIHVAVRIGDAGPIVVHAQSNIQEKVTAGVRDGTLRIEANDDFTVANPVVVDVVVPTLDAVTLSGGAAIEVTGLDAETVDVFLSGGATATISGAAASMMLTATGGSVATLGGLEVETVSVKMDGGATVELDASGSVTGEASGGAHLTVSGDASVRVSSSGGAQVEQI